MSENTPELDVEAIRARLDALAPIPAPWEAWEHEGETNIGADAGQYVAHIGKSTWPNTPLAAELIAHAPTDLRRLLDERESLLAHNGVLVTEVRFQAERAEKARTDLAARDRTVEALSARLTVKNAELDKVIREAAADKAKLAAVEAPREYRCPWCTSTRWTSVTVEGRAMAQCALCEAIHTDLGLTPAPEMPRPPAEEAPPVSMVERSREVAMDRCPVCGGGINAWESCINGVVMQTGTSCGGTCGSIWPEWTHPEMPRLAAQPPASGPETPGTGSGRGTGVTGADGTAQVGDDA